MAGGSALFIVEKPLRVGVRQNGVRRRVVVHHVDDALHAPVVDGVHQMAEVLHSAVLRVDAPVVPDGVGAAQRPLAPLLPDGVDGHEPHNVRSQRPQAIQIALQRPEGALWRVIAHKYAV